MELNTNEIDDFRKGNHAVFEKLIETYKNRVYANVIRLVHHKMMQRRLRNEFL